MTIADFAEKDRALKCDDIAAERKQIADAMQADNSAIEGNRTRNQVAGYLGGLFLVPAIALENNDTEKAQISQLYQRQDTLIELAALKRCPTSQ